MTPQVLLNSGSLIVFEGMDATGKSTQLERLHDAANKKSGTPLFHDPRPLFTHQPSGEDALGREIYALTENYKDELSSWARQFLHLASHANHYKDFILPSVGGGIPVFMDRCWWSTFAYGFVAGKINLTGQIAADRFLELIQLPAQGLLPSIVFCFLEPHAEDPHNSPLLREGYELLMDIEHGRYPIVLVPKLNVEQTTAFIFQALVEHGLAA